MYVLLIIPNEEIKCLQSHFLNAVCDCSITSYLVNIFMVPTTQKMRVGEGLSKSMKCLARLHIYLFL